MGTLWDIFQFHCQFTENPVNTFCFILCIIHDKMSSTVPLYIHSDSTKLQFLVLCSILLHG